jgi:hypothetical protein
MEEEMLDIDDYVDWLKWVSDGKRRKQSMFEFSNCEKILVLLQI